MYSPVSDSSSGGSSGGGGGGRRRPEAEVVAEATASKNENIEKFGIAEFFLF